MRDIPDDARVGEAGEQPCLLLEPGDLLGRGIEQHLCSDHRSGVQVEAPVHLAHAAGLGERVNAKPAPEQVPRSHDVKRRRDA